MHVSMSCGISNSSNNYVSAKNNDSLANGTSTPSCSAYSAHMWIPPPLRTIYTSTPRSEDTHGPMPRISASFLPNTDSDPSSQPSRPLPKSTSAPSQIPHSAQSPLFGSPSPESLPSFPDAPAHPAILEDSSTLQVNDSSFPYPDE